MPKWVKIDRYLFDSLSPIRSSPPPIEVPKTSKSHQRTWVMLTHMQDYMVTIDHNNDDMATNKTIKNFFLFAYYDLRFYEDTITYEH